MSKNEYDVIVIGGGAAGMFGSAAAADRGSRVLLLERNERVGRKLSITGKGRCNLTNDCSVGEVLENIPTGGRFLFSALNGFSPSDTIRFFRSIGVPLKTERGNRVFPQSDKAADIVDALSSYAANSGVTQRRCRVRGLTMENGRITGVSTPEGNITCASVILATGGLSYPDTGSTGDGYVMAKSCGHTVTALRGSLVPLVAKADICERAQSLADKAHACAKMQGLTLKNVRLCVRDGAKKPVFEDFGELLFTHFGLSGPLALSASAHMRDFDNKEFYVEIDLKPALDEKKLDLRILRDFEKKSNRDFSNSLGDLLNRLMIPVIVEKSGIPPDTKVHSVSREQRHNLIKLLKSFRIDIAGPRPIEEAIVTSGGVETLEINPKTMESKIVKGLYFAGEIINADAYTGGFNLQIAWSTSHAAGNSAAMAARG